MGHGNYVLQSPSSVYGKAHIIQTKCTQHHTYNLAKLSAAIGGLKNTSNYYLFSQSQYMYFAQNPTGERSH